VLNESYTSSHAIVIGINAYAHANPLSFAVNDAQAIAACLSHRFGFPDENIHLLLDEVASRQRIIQTYLSFANCHIEENDRIVFFFAGHGTTRSGARRETGYLVPVDGHPSDLSTLIRWDELTRNADLIPAKHLIFFMDACYGGLAITRTLSPGSARFLHEMLRRPARQVLAAGKADQVVSDGDGPRPNHSIFTGHLLDALEGAATNEGGILSANAVMAYVYQRVGTQDGSIQVPQYGHLEGDGDFIFAYPGSSGEIVEAETGLSEDILIQAPTSLSHGESESELGAFVSNVKQLLSADSNRIELDDLVNMEIRRLQEATSLNSLPVSDVSPERDVLEDRLDRYQHLAQRPLALVGLLSRWGTSSTQPLLSRLLARSCDNLASSSGFPAWIHLRWLPVTEMIYAGAISAIYAQNYQSLSTLLNSNIQDPSDPSNRASVFVLSNKAMLEVVRTDILKRIPQHERHYVPKSELLFARLQAPLEDLHFLGSEYEYLFDRYEVFQALYYAHVTDQAGGREMWGPPGRFFWKERIFGTRPFDLFVEEVVSQGEGVGFLSNGLFNGSLIRFQEVVTAYREMLGRRSRF
jgi:hypothetical protein